MITRELPQYADVVRQLMLVLAGLPPKLIAIDGPMCSGKTTLGRHLAWRFNVTLIEADLFAVPGSKPIAHRAEEVTRLIEARLGRERPIIVDSVAVLRLLESMQRKPDFLLYVTGRSPDGFGSVIDDQQLTYETRYGPRAKADLVVELELPREFPAADPE